DSSPSASASIRRTGILATASGAPASPVGAAPASWVTASLAAPGAAPATVDGDEGVDSVTATLGSARDAERWGADLLHAGRRRTAVAVHAARERAKARVRIGAPLGRSRARGAS